MANVSNGGRTALLVLVVCFFAGLYLIFGGTKHKANPGQPAPRRAIFEAFATSDEITAAIRDKGSRLVRVEVESAADRKMAAELGRIVGDFGSFIVMMKNPKTDLSRTGLEHQEVDTSVNVPAGKFDPLTRAPAGTVRAGTESSKVRGGYYIVQFGGTVTDEWLDSVRDAGVEVIQYVPHQAFYVYGDADSIARVAGHSRVRWVGEFTPEHKLPPALNEFTRSTESATAKFDVVVFSRADIDLVKSKIAAEVEGAFHGSFALPNNFFGVVRVEMRKADVVKIAAIPEVIRIDPYIPPQIEDERAAHIVAGNYVSLTSLVAPGYNPQGQFGVDGTGVTVMVSDDGISIPGNGGFYLTSANTVDAPLRGAGAGASGGHGHLNASIIAGTTPFGLLDPLGYNYGLGIAPKANIINVPFLRAGYPSDASSDAVAVNDALTTLGPNGVRGTISNNSWGSGLNNNAYDSLAATYDALVRDGSFAASIDPFSVIFSAGNSGPAGNSLTRPKTAKNVISVANSENLRSEFGASGADNIDDLRSSSSRGPTADGRIKPDITAPGTFVAGSRAGTCTSVGSCFDANHAWSSGTSHAAPQVAGMAALFTQHWRDTHAGVDPSPSLIKAAILSTGQEMNGVTTGTSTIPNGNEGWGRVNLKMMLNTGVPMKHVNQEVPFAEPGATMTFSGSVADPTRPVRVALVWTDPPAASDPALVNNLDLQVNIGGSVYKGNVFSGGMSVAGGSADTKDNVEMVFLPAGVATGTPFTITVTAAAINGDGILGNSDSTDQNFSLVAYNFADQPATAFWTVDGRVQTAEGRGIAHAVVRMADSNGNTLLAHTNGFGYFNFANVPGGRTYTVTIATKRYTFASQGLSVNSNLSGLTFVPNP